VATGLEAAHRNALKIACFRCGYLSSFCGRWTTGAATRPTSHLVLKQSGALLNWRPKGRRSQTLNGELAKTAACIACRADAKELNPAGLSIPASTQLDHPLADHIVRPKSACFGLGCRIAGVPIAARGSATQVTPSGGAACALAAPFFECARSAIASRVLFSLRDAVYKVSDVSHISK